MAGKTKRGRNVQAIVDANERQVRALELRKAGVSYQTIADTLGYGGPSGAFKAVQTALKTTLREPAEELRSLEMERLDQAAFAIAAQVRAGNLGAIDRLLRIMERRAKMLGLDRMIVGAMVDLDLSKLSDEQLQRIADGEDPVAVLASSGRD